jgi:hypothetical protein
MRQAAAEVGETVTGCSDVAAVGGCSDPEAGAIVSRLCCFSCSEGSKAVGERASPSTTGLSTDAHAGNGEGDGQVSDTSQGMSVDVVSNHSSGQGKDATATRQSTDTRAEEQTSGQPSPPPASQGADVRAARSGDGRNCSDDDGAVTEFAAWHNATGITGCAELADHCHDIWVGRTCCATCARAVCEDNHALIADLLRASHMHSIDGCSAVSDSCDDPFVRRACCSTCARAPRVISSDVDAAFDPAAAAVRIPTIGATNVKKEHFHLSRRGEHLLLRVPPGPEPAPSLEVRAHVSVDVGLTCRPYLSDVTIGGTWLGKKTVSFRPKKTNKFNKDKPFPFAARVFSSGDTNGPWRTSEKFPLKEEVSDQVAIGVVARPKGERSGGVGEAFKLTVAPPSGRGAAAAILVFQGAHGLHAELLRLGKLGTKHLGGLLGTEGRSSTEESPTKECVAMQANRTGPMLEEEWRARPQVWALWS